jgi:hypothetical protein
LSQTKVPKQRKRFAAVQNKTSKGITLQPKRTTNIRQVLWML